MKCIMTFLLMALLAQVPDQGPKPAGGQPPVPTKLPGLSHRARPGDANAILLLMFLGVPALILFVAWFWYCVKESNGGFAESRTRA